MGRWLGGIAAACLVVLATLVSGATVHAAFAPLSIPAYLPPAVGFACGWWFTRFDPRRLNASAETAIAPAWRIGRQMIAAGLCALTLLAAAAGAGQSVDLTWAAARLGAVPAFALPFVGAALGYGEYYLALRLETRSDRPPPDKVRDATRLGVVLILLWAVAALAVALHALAFAQAMVAALAGTAAAPCALDAIRRLNAGDSIGVDSNWGGLGGALGGWRLTRLTASSLLTVVFGAVMLVVVIGWPQPPPAASAPAKAAAPAAAGSAKPAAPKPGA